MKIVAIVSATGTPIGDFGESLKSLKPVDLMIKVIEESLNRARLRKESIDQVITGNCFAPLDQNVARLTSLLNGIPYEVRGHTIQCVCISPLKP